jgi:hypothetical protein
MRNGAGHDFSCPSTGNRDVGRYVCGGGGVVSRIISKSRSNTGMIFANVGRKAQIYINAATQEKGFIP